MPPKQASMPPSAWIQSLAFVDPERMRNYELLRRRPHSGSSLAIQFTAEKAFKAERMIDGNWAALPVKEFVHSEDMDVPPTELLTIGDFHDLTVMRYTGPTGRISRDSRDCEPPPQWH